MMYGLGIPILFPIAAVAYLVLYCTEKLMLHYAYKQPPMYDERINNNVLSIMTYAPLMFLAFGYWMLTSKQLLGNEVYPFENTSDVTRSGHLWTESFSLEAYNANPGMPLLIMFWVFLLGTIFRNYIYKHLANKWASLRVGEFEIDEDLDNYFKTLDDHDRNWSIQEEEYTREVMNMRLLQDETLEKFKNTQPSGPNMKGVHCYDILANPFYVDRF